MQVTVYFDVSKKTRQPLEIPWPSTSDEPEIGHFISIVDGYGADAQATTWRVTAKEWRIYVPTAPPGMPPRAPEVQGIMLTVKSTE